MRRWFGILLILVISLSIDSGAATDAVRLEGSPASMIRQHLVARHNRLAFAQTPADVAKLVESGQLAPVPGNADYTLLDTVLPFAHPTLRTLIERVSRRYRAACGEQLVVTSLLRPESTQPPNSHVLSVHPAGAAVDLRIPERPECRRFLVRALLDLEAAGVLDVTEERRPPHLHVAIFPGAYAEHVEEPSLVAGHADAGNGERWGSGDGVAVPGPIWLAPAAVVALAGVAVGGVLFVQRRRRRRDGS